MVSVVETRRKAAEKHMGGCHEKVTRGKSTHEANFASWLTQFEKIQIKNLVTILYSWTEILLPCSAVNLDQLNN